MVKKVFLFVLSILIMLFAVVAVSRLLFWIFIENGYMYTDSELTVFIFGVIEFCLLASLSWSAYKIWEGTSALSLNIALLICIIVGLYYGIGYMVENVDFYKRMEIDYDHLNKRCPIVFSDDGTMTIGDGKNQYLLQHGYLPIHHPVIEKIVVLPGVVADADASGLFRDLSLVNEMDLRGLDTSLVTNMDYMFYNCECLQKLDLRYFDTSHVESMKSMFYGCKRLRKLRISSFDTSNVTCMGNMFYACKLLEKIDITGFDTSKVEDMSYMFSKCEEVRKLDLANFNTESVKDMTAMFHGLHKVKKLDLRSFNTANVKNMSCMFSDCFRLKKIVVDVFDTSNADDLSNMFQNCDALKEAPIESAETVQTLNHMKEVRFTDSVPLFL